jgi:hypothetical protein
VNLRLRLFQEGIQEGSWEGCEKGWLPGSGWRLLGLGGYNVFLLLIVLQLWRELSSPKAMDTAMRVLTGTVRASHLLPPALLSILSSISSIPLMKTLVNLDEMRGELISEKSSIRYGRIKQARLSALVAMHYDQTT